jgi:hypothetical protein
MLSIKKALLAVPSHALPFHFHVLEIAGSVYISPIVVGGGKLIAILIVIYKI